MRQIFWYRLRFNIWLKHRNLQCIDDFIADSLSRFQVERFRLLIPDADQGGNRCQDRLWHLIWD